MEKKINKIILTIATFFITTQNVFGANTYIRLLQDSDGNTVSGIIGNKSDSHHIISIGEDKSSAEIGYCLDIGMTLGDQKYIGTMDKNLEGYLTDILNDSSKVKTVANKINQYVHFGYRYNGQNTDQYIVATQKLIWDELYNAGYRKEHYSPDIIFKSLNGIYDISKEVSTIKSNINNYYKTPSMCSSTTKLEIAVGETMTYEDTNKVLSNYKVNCNNGLTCEVKGNTLKVTANSEGTEQIITFTKEGLKDSGSVIYKRTDEQAVLMNSDPLEGVSCQFGIDTYKNVQTSGTKFIYIISIGLFSGIIAYISYYTKKTLGKTN